MNVPQCAGDRVYVFKFQVRHKKILYTYLQYSKLKSIEISENVDDKN